MNDKKLEKKLNDKLASLYDDYKKAYVKCKTEKCLAILEEMFDLGSNVAANELLKAYRRGYIYIDISQYDSLYKKMRHPWSYYDDNNAVGISAEKQRYYLQKLLDRYGIKATLSHMELTPSDNFMIGSIKVTMAYTYFRRRITSKYDKTSTKYFVVEGTEGTEYDQYIKWIKEAASLNLNQVAMMDLAVAYFVDYELMGVPQDISKATALAIHILKNFDNRNLPIGQGYIFRDEVQAFLRELGKTDPVAKAYYEIVMHAEKKALLQRRAEKMALEHARVSFLNEIGDFQWHDSKTGEKIENIEAALDNMQRSIENIEELLKTM